MYTRVAASPVAAATATHTLPAQADQHADDGGDPEDADGRPQRR